MRVTIRGQTGQCYLNGDSGGEFGMPHLLNGRVGFFVEDAALFHFRNIVVKAPDGMVLLEGLPEGLRDPAGPDTGAQTKMPAGAVPAAASDLDRIATGTWIRLVDSTTVLTDPQNMRFENGVLELDATRLVFPEINARDVILRARVRKVSGQNLHMGVRRDAGNFGAFFAGADLFGGDFFGIGKSVSGNSGQAWRDLAISHIRRTFEPDQFVDMAFAAIGDTLSLYVDGTRVITVKNPEVAGGTILIGAHKGQSLFKDVEYQILDPVSR